MHSLLCGNPALLNVHSIQPSPREPAEGSNVRNSAATKGLDWSSSRMSVSVCTLCLDWWWWSPEGLYIHGVLPRKVLLDTSPLNELLIWRWIPAYCLSSSSGQYSNIGLKATDPEDWLWVASHLQGEFRGTVAKRGAPWCVVVTSTSQFLSL